MISLTEVALRAAYMHRKQMTYLQLWKTDDIVKSINCSQSSCERCHIELVHTHWHVCHCLSQGQEYMYVHNEFKIRDPWGHSKACGKQALGAIS